MHPMAHDGLPVLDSLGGKEVPQIEALNCQGAVDNLARHFALDLGLAEGQSLRMGFISLSHCFRERAAAIRGYSIVFMMVWFKQYQASCLAMCLERIASAHLNRFGKKNFELGILVSIGSRSWHPGVPGLR